MTWLMAAQPLLCVKCVSQVSEEGRDSSSAPPRPSRPHDGMVGPARGPAAGRQAGRSFRVSKSAVIEAAPAS